MSTVTILALPLSSPANASSSGAMVLHGPHHSAPNSTSTGSSLSRTSCSKFRSLTVGRGIVIFSENSERPLWRPSFPGSSGANDDGRGALGRTRGPKQCVQRDGEPRYRARGEQGGDRVRLGCPEQHAPSRGRTRWAQASL